RSDYRDAAADDIGHQRRQTVVLAAKPVVFHPHVLAFDIAAFTKPFLECGCSEARRIGRPGIDKCDNRDRLLRARRERPRRCYAAEQRDELASPHSITSSARASSVGGTSIPSVFAVLRLITSSNLVGCSTGRSAGLAPFRILSTYAALRR